MVIGRCSVPLSSSMAGTDEAMMNIHNGADHEDDYPSRSKISQWTPSSQSRTCPMQTQRRREVRRTPTKEDELLSEARLGTSVILFQGTEPKGPTFLAKYAWFLS